MKNFTQIKMVRTIKFNYGNFNSCFLFCCRRLDYKLYLDFLTNNIPSDFSVYFSELNSSPYQPIILTFLFLFIVAIFPYRGVNKGIEKANNFMMPTLAVALILLAIVAISLPGAKEGLEFMFKPDFSKFSEELILTALGQALLH